LRGKRFVRIAGPDPLARVAAACSGAGKKRPDLVETGVACLTVPDVTDGTHWRCVVAAGRVTRLSGPLARVRALDLIRRKRGGTLPPPRRLAKLLAAAVFRLDVTD
jgi:nitroimidazol reductase NimA-like FMN-containing flavoprotein (pyridoxamine 5'-phosphate oxidase superfamily)